jgi:hypothetical protein
MMVVVHLLDTKELLATVPCVPYQSLPKSPTKKSTTQLTPSLKARGKAKGNGEYQTPEQEYIAKQSTSI